MISSDYIGSRQGDKKLMNLWS